MSAKHGALYPRAVDLPPMHGNFDRITVHFLFAEKSLVPQWFPASSDITEPVLESFPGRAFSVYIGVDKTQLLKEMPFSSSAYPRKTPILETNMKTLNPSYALLIIFMSATE